MMRGSAVVGVRFGKTCEHPANSPLPLAGLPGSHTTQNPLRRSRRQRTQSVPETLPAGHSNAVGPPRRPPNSSDREHTLTTAAIHEMKGRATMAGTGHAMVCGMTKRAGRRNPNRGPKPQSETRLREQQQRAQWGYEQGLRPGTQLPTTDPTVLFWLPIRFACGHALDVGIDTARYPADFRERLAGFLESASASPCVRCGSETGAVHDRPVTADPTYLVAHDLWYRACPMDQQADATRNAESARHRRDLIG